MKILERYLIEHEGKIYRCHFGKDGSCDDCPFTYGGSQNCTNVIEDRTKSTLRSHCNELINKDRDLHGAEFLTWKFESKVPDKRSSRLPPQSELELEMINDLL